MVLKLLLLLGLFSVAFAVTANPSQQPHQLLGRAYKINSDELLYQEYHHWSSDRKIHFVYYRDVDGNIWAEKQLEYDGDFNTPSFRQQNYISGEELIVEQVDDGRISVVYNIGSQERKSPRVIATPEDLVIDAGFDHYIRSHWTKLLMGEKLLFNYLVPSRQKTYSFSVRLTECGDADEMQTCFRIGAGHWWMGILVDPIYLTYDKTERKLLRFVGLGNIADDSGDYLNVDIRYEYP